MATSSGPRQRRQRAGQEGILVLIITLAHRRRPRNGPGSCDVGDHPGGCRRRKDGQSEQEEMPASG
ncbi:MAG: hypothetical protein AAF349_16110 [Cyanobacteria bacterium P01_A01_bin.68]